MAHTTFANLPLDVVQSIVNVFIDPYDLAQLRTLRSVCRGLDVIVQPILFRDLDILGWGPKRLKCGEILAALATRSTRVFMNTVNLRFRVNFLYYRTRIPHAGDTELREVVQSYLFDALSSLENLQHLSWVYDPDREPPEIGSMLVQSIGKLSSLKSLDLQFLSDGFPSTFSLQPLCNLQTLAVVYEHNPHLWIPEVAKLIARSPNLEKLRVEHRMDRPCVPLRLRDLFDEASASNVHLQLKSLVLRGIAITSDDFKNNACHFRHLEFLNLTRCISPPLPPSEGIYSGLKEGNVTASRIYTDAIHDSSLLDYLTSSSGVEEISVWADTPPGDSPESIDRFFRVVLPSHNATLKKLTLCATHKARATWSEMTSAQLQGVMACQELRELDITILVTDVDLKAMSYPTLSNWLLAAARLTRLNSLGFYFIPVNRSGIWLTHQEELRKLLGGVIDEFKKTHHVRFKIKCSDLPTPPSAWTGYGYPVG